MSCPGSSLSVRVFCKSCVASNVRSGTMSLTKPVRLDRPRPGEVLGRGYQSSSRKCSARKVDLAQQSGISGIGVDESISRHVDGAAVCDIQHPVSPVSVADLEVAAVGPGRPAPSTVTWPGEPE